MLQNTLLVCLWYNWEAVAPDHAISAPPCAAKMLMEASERITRSGTRYSKGNEWSLERKINTKTMTSHSPPLPHGFRKCQRKLLPSKPNNLQMRPPSPRRLNPEKKPHRAAVDMAKTEGSGHTETSSNCDEPSPRQSCMTAASLHLHFTPSLLLPSPLFVFPL